MNYAEHRRFVELWDKGNYRGGSTAQRLVDRILVHIPEGASIHDYGSGTGRAEVEILKRRMGKHRITMIDIAPNALEDECLALMDDKLKFLHADISDIGLLPVADWGLVINTLMTVPRETLDACLREIRRTCKNLFFEAYDMDDFRMGSNQTKTKLNATEWKLKLLEHWPEVYEEHSPESDRRYIFICYS